MRSIAEPLVVPRPSGARIRTRLRVGAADAQVLGLVGEWLGRLAGRDLTARCRLGRGDDRRADRKHALTAASSSRWAGALTRTSNDQWQRAYENLLDTRVGLDRAIRRVQARLRVPVGQRHGRVRGYGSRAERFQKQRRLQHLQARRSVVEARIAQGRVAVCRGGRRLAKLRHVLDRDDVALTEAEWRARWQAARLFVTADGEAGRRWGNETVRVHPDDGWLELKLPAPLAHLANAPHGRYRLACPVRFGYRAGEWAAQAASGAVRYDLWLDPARNRWYADAGWRLAAGEVPSLAELRQDRTLGVDLNATHLDGWVLDPAGNPVGPPHTIGLGLDGVAGPTRDGRLRAAVAQIIRLAKQHGCRSVTVEDLDFADARQVGREAMGRGRRGRRFRRTVTGMPTGQFREALVGMAANAGLWVVAVDPAWTSSWGARYWTEPLSAETKQTVTISGHHAAAVVIGRRGLGCGARRRPGVAQAHRRMGNGELPARLDHQAFGCEGPGPPGGQRAVAPPRKTRQAERIVPRRPGGP